MGGALGAFMTAFASNSSMSERSLALPMKEQLSIHYRLTGYKMRTWAKMFGELTLVWQGMECVVEKARGTSDMYNSCIAGFLTGAATQYSSPLRGRLENFVRLPLRSMCTHGLGLFAFSFCIDLYMDPHGRNSGQKVDQFL